jgi:hypothetical protein
VGPAGPRGSRPPQVAVGPEPFAVAADRCLLSVSDMPRSYKCIGWPGELSTPLTLSHSHSLTHSLASTISLKYFQQVFSTLAVQKSQAQANSRVHKFVFVLTHNSCSSFRLCCFVFSPWVASGRPSPMRQKRSPDQALSALVQAQAHATPSKK